MLSLLTVLVTAAAAAGSLVCIHVLKTLLPQFLSTLALLDMTMLQLHLLHFTNIGEQLECDYLGAQ
jgi:hypothetical protein